MPDDVSVNYKSNYAPAEIGAVIGGADALADLMKGNVGIADAAKGQGMQIAKLIEPLVSFGTLGTDSGTLACITKKNRCCAWPLCKK